MTREEFESILEEVFEEGYNQALNDIEQEITNEEADETLDFDLEDDYKSYTEGLDIRKRLNNIPGKSAVLGLKGQVAKTGSNFQHGLKSYKAKVLSKARNASSAYDKNKQLIKKKFNRLLAKRSI